MIMLGPIIGDSNGGSRNQVFGLTGFNQPWSSQGSKKSETEGFIFLSPEPLMAWGGSEPLKLSMVLGAGS